jgi:N-acetylmuramoyl-L-alanine amidase
MRFKLILILYFSFLAEGECSEVFVTVQAEKGDGIYGILRRYQLDKNKCNFDKFLELNQLKKDAGLVAGKIYLVPVKIVPYNGLNIRSSVGIEDWETAIDIQQYNEKALEQKLKKKDYKLDNELWVPYHLIHCKQEIRSRDYPIFGKKLAYTPLKSTTLSGKIFYIVSGHGGPDPGAIGTRLGHKLCEDEYAYDVALRLTRLIIENGGIAYMIIRDNNDGIRSGAFLECDQDEVAWGEVSIPLDQLKRLEQRANIINQLYLENSKKGYQEQKTVIIHVDSRNTSQRTDVFFYFQKENRTSYELAKHVHQVMEEKYRKYRSNGSYHGTVTSRDLYMLRKTNTPAVYIELANIKNATDQQRIVLDSNRQLLAEWIYEGLCK